MVSRAERLTPERVSLAEATSLLKRTTKSQVRREIIRKRLWKLPASGRLSTSEAGFFLVLSRASIGDRIRAGELAAIEVDRPDGGFAYRMDARDVRRLVDEVLDPAPSRQREERLERIRAESFEGRGAAAR